MVTKRRQDRHARKTESLHSGLGVLHFPRLSSFHLLLYLSSVKGQINKLVESIQRLNLPFGINLSDRYFCISLLIYELSLNLGNVDLLRLRRYAGGRHHNGDIGLVLRRAALPGT